MKYTKESVRVGPSRHGLGVFSLQSFAPGASIGPLPGEIIDNPEYSSDYCIELRAAVPWSPRLLSVSSTTVVSPIANWFSAARKRMTELPVI